MLKCDQCGREETLPFRCAYCGGNYCAKHRLPENHDCTHRPKTPPPYLTAHHKRQPSEMSEVKRKHFPLNKIAALTIIAIIVGGIIWAAYPTLIQLNQSSSNASSPSTTAPQSTPTSSNTFTSPESTPSENTQYGELVDYALSLVNSDRQSYGLQNVTLSIIDSGQRHAENMLENSYLSHWDTNGYKPYMRYTLANGKGAISENVAWLFNSGGLDPVHAIEKLEYDMMYDDADSNWGHRDNILDPLHNSVSIGIAYDNRNVYLVQDFENDYISWDVLSINNDQVTLHGTVEGEQSTIKQIAIFYDTPIPLSSSQLEEEQYQDGYGAGTYVGLILPPNWQAAEGITITADNWTQSGNDFQISFSLSQAVTEFTKGVYTLYLETGSSAADALLTYSIWIN